MLRVGGDTPHPKADEEFSLWFTPNELASAQTFKLPTRRDEWLQSRFAAKQLAMQLGLADDPRAITIERPSLERPSLVIKGITTDWRVSLSHSAPFVGAAISRAPIGIDVQSIRELDERAAHLFLSPEETDQMLECTLAHRILHFWCAKEAAWKQRSEEFATLRQVPLPLLEKRDDGLLFDAAETFLAGDVIVAATRPTS
ncbi:MAG TPA: 4'-phosphopantetheinyl transferase superfamily protein [Thermoanaerobaculia bacterium]|nr:4'-phosphopantetheinyl transferase superfamily protein [Thermoanaerobaculia bacterium]